MIIVVRLYWSTHVALIFFISAKVYCMLSFLSMVGSVLIYLLVVPILSSRLHTLVSSVMIYRTSWRWCQRLQLVTNWLSCFCFPCASVRVFLSSKICLCLSRSFSLDPILIFRYNSITYIWRCYTTSPIWKACCYLTLVSLSIYSLETLSCVVETMQTNVKY